MPLTYETFTTSIDTKLDTGLHISLAVIVAILWHSGLWFQWKLTINNALLRLIYVDANSSDFQKEYNIGFGLNKWNTLSWNIFTLVLGIRSNLNRDI